MTLETLAQKGSFLTTIIGDFNAKSCSWYSHDKTNFEGTTIERITSQFGLNQFINEPTHLLQNSSSIDIEVIRTVFFFLLKYFAQKKHTSFIQIS